MMGRVPASILVFLLGLLAVVTMAGPVSGPESPPPSLDALYPPKASGPVFLQTMAELNASLAGIVVDLQENDRAGVMAGFERFQSLYRKTASMVPEWSSRYPEEPLARLEGALREGAPDAVMAAVGRLGAVCHDCHLTAMVPAQQKYRWADFGSITVQDPIRGVDLSYPEFMQMLNMSLAGIGVDLGQGQADGARLHLDALAARMAALRESCGACHDTERAYFVNAGIDSLLSGMRRILWDGNADPGAIARFSREIGTESCSNCHLVHLPAAYARR